MAAPPAMVKDKSGEGDQTAVGLDTINDGVCNLIVLQRGRAVMACLRRKSQDMAELEIDKGDVHDRKKWRRNVMKRKSNPYRKTDYKPIIIIL